MEMRAGWKRIEQGTDEIHVYRQIGRPCYEVHGYRLNRCRWLWHVLKEDEYVGRKEHETCEAAMLEAERIRERELERLEKQIAINTAHRQVQARAQLHGAAIKR